MKAHRLISRFIFLSVVSLFVSCNEEANKENRQTADTTIEIADTSNVATGAQNDTSLITFSDKILTSLRDKNYKQFVSYFHPEGVRFSPYGYIDTTNAVRLTAVNFLLQQQKNSKIFWGLYDGSGDSILLHTNEYIKRFVYNADFLHAEKKAVNKIIGHGNSLNNIKNIYPNADFTESHFSGFDKKYGGMDWTSLRLVFSKLNGRYYLIAVIHDQWTS
jgi:hypothetical protein